MEKKVVWQGSEYTSDSRFEYDQTHQEALHVFILNFGRMQLIKLEFLSLTVSS